MGAAATTAPPVSMNIATMRSIANTVARQAMALAATIHPRRSTADARSAAKKTAHDRHPFGAQHRICYPRRVPDGTRCKDACRALVKLFMQIYKTRSGPPLFSESCTGLSVFGKIKALESLVLPRLSKRRAKCQVQATSIQNACSTSSLCHVVNSI